MSKEGLKMHRSSGSQLRVNLVTEAQSMLPSLTAAFSIESMGERNPQHSFRPNTLRRRVLLCDVPHVTSSCRGLDDATSSCRRLDSAGADTHDVLENPGYTDTVRSTDSNASALRRSISVPAAPRKHAREIFDDYFTMRENDNQNSNPDIGGSVDAEEGELSAQESVPSLRVVSHPSLAGEELFSEALVCPQSWIQTQTDLLENPEYVDSMESASSGAALLAQSAKSIGQQTDSLPKDSTVSVDSSRQKPPGRYIRNLLIMSFSFCFVFCAYCSVRNLQSSIVPDATLAFLTLSMFYGSVFFGCLFSTLIVQRLRPKRSMILCMWCFIPLNAANYYPRYYTLPPAAFLNGFAIAILWTAEATYLTNISACYADATGQALQNVVSKFNGIFYGIFGLAHIAGGIISATILMKQGITPDFPPPFPFVGQNSSTGMGEQLLVTTNSRVTLAPFGGTSYAPVWALGDSTTNWSGVPTNISAGPNDHPTIDISVPEVRTNTSAGTEEQPIVTFPVPGVRTNTSAGLEDYAQTKLPISAMHTNTSVGSEVHPTVALPIPGVRTNTFAGSEELPVPGVHSNASVGLGQHPRLVNELPVNATIHGRIQENNITAKKASAFRRRKGMTCGADFCNQEEAEESDTSPVDQHVLYILLAIYGGLTVIGVLLTTFLLDPLEGAMAVADHSFLHQMLALFRWFIDWRVLCVGGFTCFSLVSLTFMFGEFNVAFVTCPFGVHMIGYTMIVMYTAGSIASYVNGRVQLYTGRLPLFLLVGVIDASLLVVMLVWKPTKGTLSVLFILVGLWGAAEGIMMTQLISLYAVVFKDNKEPAFAGLKMFQSAGACLNMATAKYLCPRIKIYIVGGLLVIAVAGVAVLELVTKAQERKRARDKQQVSDTKPRPVENGTPTETASFLPVENEKTTKTTSPTPTVTTETASSAPTLATKTASPAPKKSTETASLAPTASTETASPATTVSSEMLSLAPSVSIETASPASTISIATAPPAPTISTETASIVPVTTTETASPAPGATMETASPSPTATMETASPALMTTPETASPAPRAIVEMASPAPRAIMKTASPAPRATMETASPAPRATTEKAPSEKQDTNFV